MISKAVILSLCALAYLAIGVNGGTTGTTCTSDSDCTFGSNCAKGVCTLVKCFSYPYYGAYAGSAGQCRCGVGYSGVVTYSGNVPQGCYMNNCKGDGYVNNTVSCVCAPGYTGSVVFQYGQPTGCYQNSCSGPGYIMNGLSCVCDSSAGYAGTVSFSNGQAQGCIPLACTTSPGYTGTPGSCQCAQGYFGVGRVVNGALTGCTICPVGTYSLQPNSPSCSTSNCNAPGYMNGPSGVCVCAVGYVGAAKLVGGELTGCTAIPCAAFLGYVDGQNGQCACAPGYVGTAAYTANGVTGCTQCSVSRPTATAPAIASPGYTGVNGVCVCDNSIGYIGTPSISIVGKPTGCSPVACNAVGYAGSAGSCTCAAGYSGQVSVTSTGTLIGCSPIPCDQPGYVGNPGACTCDTSNGYGGSVKYNSGQLGGCTVAKAVKVQSAGSTSIISGYAVIGCAAVAALILRRQLN